MSKKSSKIVKKTSTQTCGFDFTLFDEISTNEIRKTLNDLTKKYCFQKEIGENTKKEHYQGRFSLKIKKRLPEAVKQFNKHWKSFHLSITSNENKNNNFYVMKDETRIDGPFTNENEVFIPADVLEMTTLRPFQQKIIDMSTTYDKRSVDIIYEKGGNIGKTSICRFMMCYTDAKKLPFCNDYQSIMRMAYDVGPKKCYLFDMPRASNKTKLAEFFAGIEELKSGYAYDDRNKFRDRLFDRPRIFIFTNEIPDTSLISTDMWKLWTIKNQNLIPYNTPTDKDILIEDIDFLSDDD